MPRLPTVATVHGNRVVVAWKRKEIRAGLQIAFRAQTAGELGYIEAGRCTRNFNETENQKSE